MFRLSKEVLSPINLLVISFSVINYVVRVRVHAGCVDAHFFCIYPIIPYLYINFKWNVILLTALR